MTFVLIAKCIIYSIQKNISDNYGDQNSSGQSKKIFIILSDIVLSYLTNK
jgi:hypothetical protein